MMNFPVQNCSSCGACANVCAKGAISMSLNVEGFYRPSIDSSKCINCGACERVCPWTKDIENPNGSTSNPETFAAFAKDEKIRLESSSGGIFTVLAEKILSEKGFVIGVAQLDQTHFGHIIVDNKEDLTKLRGSKYVQADVGHIYRDVKKLLQDNRKVLFSGTPCQVAALYSVIGSRCNENLTTVDIVCHGTPSVKVFKKYIKELEATHSASAISSRFRDKQKGWRLFSMTTSLNTISGDCFDFSKTIQEDRFIRAFLTNLCLNTSCSNCHYGKLPRIADITLGDYWNIAQVHPQMDDDKGTSVAILNTKHGKELFDSVADYFKLTQSKIEYAIKGNPCINQSSKEHPKRADFFADLDKMDFKELCNKYCPKPTLLKRLWGMGISILTEIKISYYRAN